MNHFKAVPHTPNHDLRQLGRAVWSTVSNAADRSSKTNAVGSPRDVERWISFLMCSRAVSVEWPLLYADCLGLSRLLLLICCMSYLTTTSSTNFDMKHSTDFANLCLEVMLS